MTGDAVYGGMGSRKEAMEVIVKKWRETHETKTVYCINCSEPIRKILREKS
jgi:trehalose utilization protein